MPDPLLADAEEGSVASDAAPAGDPNSGDADGAAGTSGRSEQAAAQQPWWRRRPRVAAIAAASIGAVLVAAAGALGLRLHRRRQRRRRAARRGQQGRIPLQDLVRFKERQWFVEELENSRDGDPNAMLRLAKMYLHGQGCQRSAAMAQEWLRKARYLGVGASLDELYATDDPDPRGKLRRMIAAEERRRAARRAAGVPGGPGGGGSGGGGGAPSPMAAR